MSSAGSLGNIVSGLLMLQKQLQTKVMRDYCERPMNTRDHSEKICSPGSSVFSHRDKVAEAYLEKTLALTEKPSAGTRSNLEQISSLSTPTSPENCKRQRNKRIFRINMSVFIVAVAVALVMLAPSLVYTAHASTGNAGFPTFPYETLGQTNYTCQYHSANSALVLIRQPRFEQVKFSDSQCLGVNNSPALNGGLYAIINSSSAGNLGYTQGTSFSIAEIADSGFWSGCCVAGDKIFFDANLVGRLAFTGGADSLIRIIVKRQFTTCAYYATGCHMWEWMAWNPYTNAPPSNVDRSFLTSGLATGDALLNVTGPINGLYTRFYLDASIFSNSGPIEIEIDALSNSAADGAGATADFATPGFYVAILDFGYIHRSPPAAPSIASGVGTANGAYTNSPSACWNRVSDIEIITSYATQVATDSAFSNVVASRTIPEVGASAYCYLPSLSDGHYYWRVQDSDNIGQTSAWSATYNFYVDKTPPTAPTLASPPNNAITNNNQPTLTWNPSTDPGPTPSGVSYYAVEISTSSTFNGYQFATTSGTSKQAPSLADGLWYWRVEAVDNVGNIGPWSATWSITIDTTPPSTPTLQSPSNGAVSTSTTQTLTWSAATDINGVASYNIQIDTSTSFNSPNRISATGITGTSYGATLRPGIWYWEVQAVDRAGNKGSWSSYFTLNIADFTISANPSSISVLSGSPGSLTITISSQNAFSGNVVLSASSLAGFTETFSAGTVSVPAGGTATSTLTISVSGAPNAGTYQITVTGSSGSLSHPTTISVSYPGDFSITPSSPLTFACPFIAGTTCYTSVPTVSSQNGFSGTVTLSADPSPGLSATLSPSSLTVSPSSTSATANLGVSATSGGTYTITITGTSGSLTHTTATMTFMFYDFSVSLSCGSPGCSYGLTQGSTVQDTLTVTSLGSFSGTVNLSYSSGGQTVSLSTSSVTLSSGGQATVTVTITGGSSSGTVTITGTCASGLCVSPPQSHSASVSVSISCGCGGGGSVAAGTLITLANGTQVPVQNLSVGMKLLSYNMTTRQYVTITITRFVSVQTDNQMIIHTTTGRPLIVDQNPAQKLEVMFPNGTWTELSVTELKIGDYLFDASSQTWVQVTGIQYVNGGVHTMYDIYTNAPTLNYIANNYLDYVKV
jgi:hypothetical protein